MIVSVLDAGSVWRARVLQGPAARGETFASVLSVVQVRSASLRVRDCQLVLHCGNTSTSTLTVTDGTQRHKAFASILPVVQVRSASLRVWVLHCGNKLSVTDGIDCCNDASAHPTNTIIVQTRGSNLSLPTDQASF